MKWRLLSLFDQEKTINIPLSLVDPFEYLGDSRARQYTDRLYEVLMAAICAVIIGAEIHYHDWVKRNGNPPCK